MRANILSTRYYTSDKLLKVKEVEVIKRFKNFNIEVAGKTGSAEAGKDQNGNDLVNAWFVCFAPFEKPEVAVVVMIENGGHGNYAAEVARDVLIQYFGMNETTEINESTTAIPYTEEMR